MSIAFVSEKNPRFPEYSPERDVNDGLVCVTQTLSPVLLQNAYRKGLFPWFTQDGLFYWFSIHPRAVLQPENLHIHRSLAKVLHNKSYRVTVNQAFDDVIAACASVPRVGQGGTWITPEFQAAYSALNKLGNAHSFECWLPDDSGEWCLAGGFYGVQIGSVFYGESMFARQNDASKIAFACAVPFLADYGVQLIDCQQDSEHMKRFGSQVLPFGVFREKLSVLNDVGLRREIGQGIIVER
ncbi:leucyl/phenylalanyl-tRNA--protein transferase [Kingella negevensis]|uniref:leucyl/phenylalanyl-tRNA--protein transferase n=1 Tax=Kingella negevensis TaxID=1522312 RepID=UPI00254BC004|nr:leucyl/phenylalanyl-tRNA--protein transferase [Kingella negevensis]MDK4684630.1 leucyl/phenylalanyl-tRNA--protein transferase [Kingella negevensis]